MTIIFGLIAVVLGVMVFRLSSGNGWHWSAGLFLAAIPIAFALFLGIIGLLIGAVFVGALYRASG
ncbi:MAG: hypothetical protein L0241_27025 [Planctomycetia bacterium]|nr:hypothetical protein [Planctomycetia bacterium]